MILVTVGSNGVAFDRLLCEIERLEVEEPVLVQHGPSELRPRNAECVAFLPFDDLTELVSSARIVITHGGVGSVLLALTSEKRPIVVPRLARFQEVVDDHQLFFAQRLARENLVTLVDDPRNLPSIVELEPQALPTTGEQTGSLQADLRAYLHQVVNVDSPSIADREARRIRRQRH